jgi:pimeloyl-ACP methyl ester carboxylesterase
VRHVFYLHGFASSPASSKARFFAGRLAPFGITLHCPDFNLPAFETLTATRMIAQTEAALRELPPGHVALMGSSLGAFVAWHVAARAALRNPTEVSARIDRLVLLAPALDVGRNRFGLTSAEVEAWQRTGWREFFHYAANAPQRVSVELLNDAARYDSAGAHPHVPTLIFQGRRDELVPVEAVVRFAASRPDDVTLRLFDDGHQLLESLDPMWGETARFLDLPALTGTPAVS